MCVCKGTVCKCFTKTPAVSVFKAKLVFQTLSVLSEPQMVMKAFEPGNVSELNDLPLDAEQIEPYLLNLRQRAEKEPIIRPLQDLSDNFLIRFLRARDFDVELALKVRTSLHFFLSCGTSRREMFKTLL